MGFDPTYADKSIVQAELGAQPKVMSDFN